MYTYESKIKVIGLYEKETEYQGKKYKTTYVYYTSELPSVEGLYCDSCKKAYSVNIELEQEYKAIFVREKTETGYKKEIVSAQLIK